MSEAETNVLLARHNSEEKCGITLPWWQNFWISTKNTTRATAAKNVTQKATSHSLKLQRDFFNSLTLSVKIL